MCCTRRENGVRTRGIEPTDSVRHGLLLLVQLVMIGVAVERETETYRSRGGHCFAKYVTPRQCSVGQCCVILH